MGLRSRIVISPYLLAILQAIFVTILWSSSWVLIKIGIQDEIPPLPFAGLRYTLAFLCLLPFALRRGALLPLRNAPRAVWGRVLVLALCFYTLTQGTQFIGLQYLPAVNVNLLISLSTLVVIGLSAWLLCEYPTHGQWIGIVIYLIGVAIFFYPATFAADELFGVLVVLAGTFGNALSSVMGRWFGREGVLHPLGLTTASMGIGGVLLLLIGVLVQGFPTLSLTSWGIILWLAVVNTAFAFTLWNHTLKTLSAMESSIINNLMMIQIPILAWVFLGETFGLKAGIGFVIAGLGIFYVQWQGLKRQAK